MQLYSLTAISPVDGRYYKQTYVLKKIFSEYALLKFRVKVEIYWLKKLFKIPQILELPKLTNIIENELDNIWRSFDIIAAQEIKLIEKTTKHDVKALEYYLRKKFLSIPSLKNITEFIHFGCTSDDINNLAYSLMLQEATSTVILPCWKQLLNIIKQNALNYKDIAMLSHTHGQPATPSTIGKEFANFFYRMKRQYDQLKKIKFLGKLNGSTGNYNALLFAYPTVNWHQVSEEFISSLGIVWNPYTTQIEPHDYIAEFFSCISRFNTILINFNQDFWGYIALEYFKQKKNSQEVSSSIMPHKINPINFENSEANLSMANSLMNFMSTKLPISRWQRDLTDSSILRNIGLVISYSVIAYDSCLLGIGKLDLNIDKILEKLNSNWQILAEPIQTVMRKYGIKNAYELLKTLTRAKYVDSNKIHDFINSLTLPLEEKDRLKKLTPSNYVGMASEIIDNLT